MSSQRYFIRGFTEDGPAFLTACGDWSDRRDEAREFPSVEADAALAHAKLDSGHFVFRLEIVEVYSEHGYG